MHSPGRSQADEQSLATALYEQHAQAILLYIRKRISVQEDTEDLLLEVFLGALEKKIPLHLPENQQRAWLLHVAQHKLIDHYRRQARHLSVELDEELAGTLLDDEELAPESLTLRGEDHRLLRQHLATLPEAYQKVLWLRFADGLRSKAISQRMQKSDGAIRILLSRALNSLRSIYEQGDGRHEAK
jgi:RNA polymerase sigma factor (sigma-70 family)